MNFDIKKARETLLPLLNKLEEFNLDAYENANIYKEQTKKQHGKHIVKKEYNEGNLMLLFNSRLRLFLGKLKSQWSKSFKVTKVYPQRATEV